MSDSGAPPDKPNPIDDLRKGFGLLFRAAKTTLDKLPTGQIEEAVLTSAREVGRALENVQHSVEEQFRGRSSKPPAPAAAPEGPAKDTAEPAKGESPTTSPPADETKTRIG